jgi:hypothetical protein
VIGHKYNEEIFELIWYLYRCISVGFFDSLFSGLGGIAALKFEKCNYFHKLVLILYIGYTNKKMERKD